ncbi:glycosyl hydrolase family 85 protein [Pyrenochaeta sp. MPI-SDFR-AT-0127]|nr:glycosyl hydrolase family 85 protein [Pyrenochaeta sp. MPI-SDFR-AT-0127]
MAYLLGWKDILRPIRDGYRHLFPTPDTGPTPEGRCKQRELDRVKGFIYFDTFEQLEVWSEAESDLIQRANTPLLHRRYVDAKDDPGKASVLLIHDYAGNYHDYESVQGVSVDEEEYACEYLQYVDTFIYFSHKLVCVPPPTWTNSLHRNGVEALGTLLIEPQTVGSEQLLQCEDENERSFPMAKQLAKLAKHYSFDGWLINVEKSFPKDDWNAELLQMFLRDLRAELGEGKRLIWYDALTINNKVSYQNALNSYNLPFAKETGNMLTNYCWNEAGAESSVQPASEHLRSLHFGIDVWAQNTTKLTRPRITYPEKGGGGTNTGMAVAKLADLRLSAGIFAPAWSFEHFPCHGRAVERATWEGTRLPDDIDCSCGNCNTRHQPNLQSPIIRSAREYAAGSETFFYTDFSRAFLKRENKERENFGGHKLNAQLGAQSILPIPLTSKDSIQAITLSNCLEDSGGQTQLVIESHKNSLSAGDENCQCWLPLYKVDMPANGSLYFRVNCRNLLGPITNTLVSFYLKFTSGHQFLAIPTSDGIQSLESKIGTVQDPSLRLQEFGIHVQWSPTVDAGALRLVEIAEICILPQSALKVSKSCTIRNIHVEHRGEGKNMNTRLCWDYGIAGDFESINGIPYSETTGPFSYFFIRLNGVTLGRAYALEHPLLTNTMDRFKGEDIEIEVSGVGFDGQKLAQRSIKLRLQPPREHTLTRSS